jgi:hypothetical protein
LSSSSSYGGPLRPERAGDHREEIWVGDGPIYTKTCDSTSGLVHSSSVKVLDFAGTIKQTIYTGGKARADELCYNPFTNVVLMANDEPVDNFITFISTETYEVLGTIKFDGTDNKGNNILANGIEQCAFNPRESQYPGYRGRDPS